MQRPSILRTISFLRAIAGFGALLLATAASAQPDLVVSKTGPATAAAGTNVIYTITLTNNGTNGAANVVLTDVVPAGTTAFGFAQQSGATAFALAFPGGTAFTASAANFPAGSTAVFLMGVTFNAGDAPGSTVTNTATASTSTTEPNTANNSSTVNTMVDTTPPTVVATSLQTTYLGAGPASFTVTFSEPVRDPTGDSDPGGVTNPANYLLVEAGSNTTFDTLSCAGGVAGDDTQVPVAGVTYDGGTLTATVSLGGPPPAGTYRLFVCGTTSITDLAGNPLNGGADSSFDFAVVLTVPALGHRGLALLMLLLAAAALGQLRRG